MPALQSGKTYFWTPTNILLPLWCSDKAKCTILYRWYWWYSPFFLYSMLQWVPWWHYWGWRAKLFEGQIREKKEWRGNWRMGKFLFHFWWFCVCIIKIWVSSFCILNLFKWCILQWVQCDKCECWQHQICALFNGRRNDGGQAEYTCPNCYVEEVKRGLRMPLPQSAVLGAKDLPRTVLSDHIEDRLFKRLKQERQDRAAQERKSIEEVS